MAYFGSRTAKDDSDDDDEDENIERVKNTIYYYGDVNRKNVLKFHKLLREATDDIRKQMIETDCEGKIFVNICSDGGSVFDGLAAMDTIASNPVPVTTIMEGAVCSAATFLALGGKHVTIRPSGHVLIHQIRSAFWGKYEEFKDEKETLDKLMEKLRNLYSSKTNLPRKVLSEMFQRDIYINAEECIKWGVAHSIV